MSDSETCVVRRIKQNELPKIRHMWVRAANRVSGGSKWRMHMAAKIGM